MAPRGDFLRAPASHPLPPAPSGISAALPPLGARWHGFCRHAAAGPGGGGVPGGPSATPCPRARGRLWRPLAGHPLAVPSLLAPRCRGRPRRGRHRDLAAGSFCPGRGCGREQTARGRQPIREGPRPGPQPQPHPPPCAVGAATKARLTATETPSPGPRTPGLSAPPTARRGGAPGSGREAGSAPRTAAGAGLRDLRPPPTRVPSRETRGSLWACASSLAQLPQRPGRTDGRGGGCSRGPSPRPRPFCPHLPRFPLTQLGATP